MMMDLNQCRKVHDLKRIGVNATDYAGYLCEIWADDITFLSEYGKTADTAVRKGLRSLARKRRELTRAAKATGAPTTEIPTVN